MGHWIGIGANIGWRRNFLMIAPCGTKAAPRDLCPRRRMALPPSAPNEPSLTTFGRNSIPGARATHWQCTVPMCIGRGRLTPAKSSTGSSPQWPARRSAQGARPARQRCPRACRLPRIGEGASMHRRVVPTRPACLNCALPKPQFAPPARTAVFLRARGRNGDRRHDCAICTQGMQFREAMPSQGRCASR